MKIEAPHIALGISLEDALAVLHRISPNTEKHSEEDNDFYKLVSDEFECGFYEQAGKVVSSWYNDPIGSGVTVLPCKQLPTTSLVDGRPSLIGTMAGVGKHTDTTSRMMPARPLVPVGKAIILSMRFRND